MKTHKNKHFWLLKSEPDTFSIDDLERSFEQSTLWDGVRNYQARNFMRDDMQQGDLAFIYHSSCKIPAIMGIATVTHINLPDVTAWDPASEYYDPKSTPDNPRWFTVQVQFKRRFRSPITLQTLKETPALAPMALLQRGNRLSILPITEEQWQIILSMAK